MFVYFIFRVSVSFRPHVESVFDPNKVQALLDDAFALLDDAFRPIRTQLHVFISFSVMRFPSFHLVVSCGKFMNAFSHVVTKQTLTQMTPTCK